MADLSFLEKFSKGDAQKMKKYISMYLNTAPDSFKKMQQNIKDKSWSDLAINAHSLKPQAEFMGIPSLKEVLIEIENNVKKGQLNDFENLFERANAIHIESEIFLKDYLETN
jgi:HPt (histidine-containing phosphotransfer) domain-containing protein